MTTRKPSSSDHLIAEMRQAEKLRRQGYRERALKLFPHVCARCGRSFEGKKLRELTVHHVDHDHDNNPPDGSNWELLCLYCHEHEHTRGIQQARETERPTARVERPSLNHNPFAELGNKIKPSGSSNSEH